jgi:hypothetical protein
MFTHSPRIVTDGLVLALDAANVKSFRGEPTTNLLSQPTNISNWSKQQTTVDTNPSFFREIDGNLIPFYKVTSTVITDPFIILTTAVGNISNRTFTYSVYLCTDPGQPTTSIQLFTYGNVPSFEGSSVKSATVTITTEPTRYKLTSVYGAGFNSTSLAVRVDLNQATLGYLYVGEAQLEEKAYETRFVAGTRGTTVATGGGWEDKSGNSNHGELVNGPTFSSGNLGSIVFDGVDDFVQIPYSTYWNTNVFGTATNFTLECWYKPNLFKNWDTLIEKSESPGWYSRPEGASIWTNDSNIQGVFASGVDSNPAGSVVILSYATTALRWYHIAFTGDGTTLRLYVDGIQRATGLVSSRTVAVYNGNVGPRLGRRAFMDGQMALVRLYTRGIIAAEVLQNYNATKGRYGL